MTSNSGGPPGLAGVNVRSGRNTPLTCTVGFGSKELVTKSPCACRMVSMAPRSFAIGLQRLGHRLFQRQRRRRNRGLGRRWNRLGGFGGARRQGCRRRGRLGDRSAVGREICHSLDRGRGHDVPMVGRRFRRAGHRWRQLCRPMVVHGTPRQGQQQHQSAHHAVSIESHVNLHKTVDFRFLRSFHILDKIASRITRTAKP